MGGETCWTLIQGAAEGRPTARDELARIYLPVVEAYFSARWGRRDLRSEVDDAVQEVFIDLMRPNGALSRVDRDHGGGGFGAFLYGVARNIALRHEEQAGRQGNREVRLDTHADPTSEAAEDAPSRAFDRAWARALMKTARERQSAEAAAQGEEAVQRVELLRLRFEEGLPIRLIAERWGVGPARLHRQYARARKEFSAALYTTVARHNEGTAAEVRAECTRLLDLLR